MTFLINPMEVTKPLKWSLKTYLKPPKGSIGRTWYRFFSSWDLSPLNHITVWWYEIPCGSVDIPTIEDTTLCSLGVKGSVSLNMNTKAYQKDMYLPGTSLSSTLGFEPSKKRPFHSVQHKGHLGSRYTLIHYIIIYIYTCYMFSSFHTDYH